MGLLTVAVAVAVGLLAAVIALFRIRNGASEHNPNFGTLELLAKQQLQAAQESNRRLENIASSIQGVKGEIKAMREVVGHCGAVQNVRERREG